MAYVTQQIGQSMYDLVLGTYGTQDFNIQMCIDNGITDINTVNPQQQYYYNESQVHDQSFKGSVFVTDVANGNYRIFSDEFAIEFA